MEHELPLDASVLHGHFSSELAPVLAVEPGDSVRFSTPDAAWNVAPGERLAAPEVEDDGTSMGPSERRRRRSPTWSSTCG